MKRILLVTFFLAALGWPCLATSGLNVNDARLETRPAGSDLAQTIGDLAAGSSGRFWIAYTVSAIESHGFPCCGAWPGKQPCQLDFDKRGWGIWQDGDRPAPPDTDMALYLAVSAGRVDGLRLFSQACPLDAGGARIVQLTGVDPSRSVAFLDGMLANRARLGRDEWNHFLAAIAMHADASADESLTAWTDPSHDTETRKQALFWLGSARGQFGFERLREFLAGDESRELRKHAVFGLYVNERPEAISLLTDLAERDGDDHVRSQALFWLAQRGGEAVEDLILARIDEGRGQHEREQAVFALSQLPDDRGIDVLIDLARDHRSEEIRGKALFWLGQKAGERVEALLVGEIESDASVDVKKQAVFALSQMPSGEGIPALLSVARSHAQPEVRKQAMFWLGQSKDPRALELFREVLADSKR